MRLPATVNIPTSAKGKRGRKRALSALLVLEPRRVYQLDKFPKTPAFEKAEPHPDRNVNGADTHRTLTSDAQMLMGRLPERVQRLVRSSPADGYRSSATHSACCGMFDAGLNMSEVEALLAAQADGAAEKYRARGDLSNEVARNWQRWCAKAGNNAMPTLVWSRPSVTERPAQPEDEIERLAILDAFEYERVRDAEAKRLKVRVSVLDDEVGKRRKDEKKNPAPGFLEEPELWGTPVDGHALLDDIAATLGRYVVLPAHAGSTIALWVVHAHAIDCTSIAPNLVIQSPEKRCGKTTLLSLVQPLVPKALTAANMTPAAVFRAVEEFRPTLVVDEADTFLTADKSELIGIVNSSHTRATAYVLRVVGDNHDIKAFSTWCAKVIALIGELPPTLQDRAIAIRMRRRQKGETVERRRGDRLEALQELCRKAARWVADHKDDLMSCDPDMPPQLDDRAADNWRPLLAIAETAGGDWPAQARKAAMALSAARADDDEGGGILLLHDCREVLEGEWLTPNALVQRLVDHPESPWSEWRHGKPISTRGVARLLKPFGIKSEQRREDGKKDRRYYRDTFKDAWARYLRDEVTVTPPSIHPTQARQAGQP